MHKLSSNFKARKGENGAETGIAGERAFSRVICLLYAAARAGMRRERQTFDIKKL
jgi:hypothetical protein